MKIGIITLPFNWNYGGILQTYALQVALKKIGHEPYTINRDTAPMSLKLKLLSYVRRLILKIVFRKDVVVRTWPTKIEEKQIRQHTDRFIREHVKTTDLFKSETDFKNIEKYKFKAFVVGSDQVWRPKYSPVLKNHFLGFTSNFTDVKRIAYAASFGVDNWEFSSKQTRICSNLAQKFDQISVREDSAVNLCIEKLKVKSVVTLDPTMLVDKEQYIELVEKDKTPKLSGTLLNYILDFSSDKEKIVDQVAREFEIQPVSIMPKGIFREVGKNRINDCVCPPVTNWLRGFIDAEFVVTDSFHGTVFSIIFNKPFLAIGNAKRGITRFSSLLRILNLEDRLVLDYDESIVDKIKTPINYEKVNEILNVKRQEAYRFLEDSLK
jgi:hypothetical protein